jgi:hypothetical protein
MRRLVAVRQLEQLASQDKLTPQERSQAVDYLRLLIRKETEPLVRKAIRSGLKILTPAQSQLAPHRLTAAAPINLQAKQGTKVTVLDECEA